MKFNGLMSGIENKGMKKIRIISYNVFNGFDWKKTKTVRTVLWNGSENKILRY